MLRQFQSDSFQSLGRDDCRDLPHTTRTYNVHDHLRFMNDPAKRAAFDNAMLDWQSEGTTIRRLYERNEWSEFVPTVFLDGILEHTTYQSLAGQLANTVTVPSGLTFVYREFENFQRAQRGAENTEFERRKGSRTTQEVPLHTIGARSFATEEELLDVPVDVRRLEMQTMGAAVALERDLLWINSLHNATSGTNATTYNNLLQSDGQLDLAGLHAVITWFTSPFAAELDTITLTNPYDVVDNESATKVEGLMKLGKFRATDVVLNASQYFAIVNNSFLQQQNIWTNSRILDTGELQVPLLGVNIHKANVGYFLNEDDPDSWVDSDDIYLIDRRMGGGGTIGVRQPLQVRNWDMPQFRSQDFMIFQREGYVVQNRRAVIRVTQGS